MPEMVDEKQVQHPAPKPPTPSTGEGFRKLATAWIVLGAAAWGATAATLLTQAKWLGPASLTIGRWPLSMGGLAAGVLIAAGVAFLALKKLGGRLALSKPTLGRWVRGTALGGIAAMTAFGCYALYMSPSSTSIWWQDVLGPWTVAGLKLAVKPMLFPAAGVFFALSLAAYLLLNRAAWSEFLIETEGEIKKVSWPTRKDYLGSSMVVVMVIAIVSIFLHFVDSGLSWVMRKIGIGF